MFGSCTGQGMTEHQWPGIKSAQFPGHLEANYSEGLINGYRWYDKHKVMPAFPFGFGLTFGTFKYSDLQIEGRTISFTVIRRPDSPYAGCDTPQIYLSYPGADSDLQVPTKVLKYFQKTCKPSTLISYTLTDRDVSNWDVAQQMWVVTRGTYGVIAAPASHGVESRRALWAASPHHLRGNPKGGMYVRVATR